MDLENNIILVGSFHEIIELCESCKKCIIGIIEKDNRLGNQYFGYKILGTDDMASDLYKEYKNVPLIATPDIPELRKKLVKYYSEIGFKFCDLIHPEANISKYAKIGNGVIIQKGANISTNANLGDFVKINSFANIMHDSLIGKFTSVAPNAVILGRVEISESCYIGANSTILTDKKIGRNAVIGAGAVVTKNVRENATVIGNPAREKINK